MKLDVLLTCETNCQTILSAQQIFQSSKQDLIISIFHLCNNLNFKIIVVKLLPNINVFIFYQFILMFRFSF